VQTWQVLALSRMLLGREYRRGVPHPRETAGILVARVFTVGTTLVVSFVAAAFDLALPASLALHLVSPGIGCV
jgi:hypothetical protein